VKQAILKNLFAKDLNLNLLDNYRGEKRKNQKITGVFLKFFLVFVFWMTVAFLAPLFVAMSIKVIDFIPESFSFLDSKILFKESVALFVPLLCLLTFIPVNAMFLVLLERKFLALLTTRLGPNRVGPQGILQTAADAIKLLYKEDTVPKGSDQLLFFLAPAIFFAPSIIAFLPLLSVVSGSIGIFQSTNFPGNLIFIFAFQSIAVLGLVIAGWSSNNKYSLIGGLRSTAQAISYEIPLILSIVIITVFTGTLNLQEIVAQQKELGLFSWNILGGGCIADLSFLPKILEKSIFNGLLFLSGISIKILVFFLVPIIFYICSLAESNRIPFDLPEAESELVSGFNTEYSGMKFALFFLAEYTNLFISSLLIAVLFFGGPYLGIPIIDNFIYTKLTNVPFFGNIGFLWGFLIILKKTYIFIMLAIWIRATLPRLKSDQIMSLAWKALIPACLALILLASLGKIFITSFR